MVSINGGMVKMLRKKILMMKKKKKQNQLNKYN